MPVDIKIQPDYSVVIYDNKMRVKTMQVSEWTEVLRHVYLGGKE